MGVLRKQGKNAPGCLVWMDATIEFTKKHCKFLGDFSVGRVGKANLLYFSGTKAMRNNSIQVSKVWTASRIWFVFQRTVIVGIGKEAKKVLLFDKEGNPLLGFKKRGIRLEAGQEQTQVVNGVEVATTPNTITWMFPSKSGKTGGTVTRKNATYPTFSNAGRVTVLSRNGEPKLTGGEKETMTTERFAGNNPSLWELLQQADMLLAEAEEARKAG